MSLRRGIGWSQRPGKGVDMESDGGNVYPFLASVGGVGWIWAEDLEYF